MQEWPSVFVGRVLFMQRRKTVRNGLRVASGAFGRDAVDRLLVLPPEVLARRPEALYLEDCVTIANLLAAP